MLSSAPRAPTLLYDGHCGFCTACVEWLRPRLRERVRLVPWQSIVPESLGLTRSQVRASAWWIEPDDRKYEGAHAVARALRACGGAWAWIGRAIDLPVVRRLSELAYALLARIRGWLPGAEPAWPGGTISLGVAVGKPS